MATKPKLSQEEKWLEDNFKIDMSKLDPDMQEGGKKHDAFVKDCGRLRVVVGVFQKPDIAKVMKIASDDPKVKKLQREAAVHYNKMVSEVQKGDIADAVVLARKTRDAMIDMVGLLSPKRMLIVSKGGNLQSVGGIALGIGAHEYRGR